MFQLPEPWKLPEVVEDVVTLDGLTVHRAGLSTIGAAGEEVIGAAASAGAPALARGWYELVERVSAAEARHGPNVIRELRDLDGAVLGRRSTAELFLESAAPDRWRYARSNGVAIHGTWRESCERALWELVERDRVLRAWYGETDPVALDFDPTASALGQVKGYAWRACAFPSVDSGSVADRINVAGVFGFPTTAGMPFALGFAGRPASEDAVESASAEALQLLAFLWGEPVTEDDPEDGPDPGRHLDRYQGGGRFERVRRWLDEGHRRYFHGHPRPALTKIAFADLTPPWLEGLRVAQAVSDEAVPMTFGDSPFGVHLPVELRLHPIP